MINKTTLLFSLLIATFLSTAQINIQWESRLDGTGNYIDQVVDFELDGSGNTFVTGTYSGCGHVAGCHLSNLVKLAYVHEHEGQLNIGSDGSQTFFASDLASNSS